MHASRDSRHICAAALRNLSAARFLKLLPTRSLLARRLDQLHPLVAHGQLESTVRGRQNADGAAATRRAHFVLDPRKTCTSFQSGGFNFSAYTGVVEGRGKNWPPTCEFDRSRGVTDRNDGVTATNRSTASVCEELTKGGSYVCTEGEGEVVWERARSRPSPYEDESGSVTITDTL